MDSESPVAFGTAGQERMTTGTSFTADARKFGSEFRSDLAADARGRSGPRSHRRSADGDGR